MHMQLRLFPVEWGLRGMHHHVPCWIVSDWDLHGHNHADLSAVHHKCAVHGRNVSCWDMPGHHDPNVPDVLCLHWQSVCVIELHVEL